MKIILLRHTETTSNASNLADSLIDAHLTEKGLVRAKSIVKELSKNKPDVIYRSPLKRTLQTLEPYIDSLGKEQVVIIENDLLLERDLGEYTGSAMGTFQKYCDDNKISRVTTRPQNGESLIDVYEKTKRFLSETLLKHNNESILVCGHKNNLMCLEIAIEEKDMDDYYSFKPLETGEIREFELI